MVKAILICAALVAVSLTGCAGLSTDVHTANPAASFAGARTYTIARPPSQDASASAPSFETLLRAELAKQGFVDTQDLPAHYLLSIAYDTRPATISVATKDCPPGECDRATPAPFSLFDGPVYQHGLTLRFFERASGREIYKVSAMSRDRDADALHAMPSLVKSALARFPFDAPPDWRVKLRAHAAGGVPEVTSVKPLQP
ncbi:DUF4136 domain-containing protein [Paraburkholderia sp. BCC1884]|uniref:DUF4136 domain-containing protein n=1 Tax=Paraburkholderia sp. BCC1884 TaxID=2562668 RepID=UPI0011829B34|nr:DUF4136 domain-containing protein [Paraburkholderia sp. BCC1884]